jgi:hypothetical protein
MLWWDVKALTAVYPLALEVSVMASEYETPSGEKSFLIGPTSCVPDRIGDHMLQGGQCRNKLFLTQIYPGLGIAGVSETPGSPPRISSRAAIIAKVDSQYIESIF